MGEEQLLERHVRTACRELGVPDELIPGYVRFARSVAQVEQEVNGVGLAAFAGALVERHARQGLDRRVMYRLLADVFAIRPDSDWPV